MVLVLTGHLTDIKGRWLQPLLFTLPLAVFIVFPATAMMLVYRRLLMIAGLIALLMLAGLSLRPQLEYALGKLPRNHQPYPELASELARRFPHAQAFVAQDKYVAGNLLFHQSQLPALLLQDVLNRTQIIEGNVLLLVRSGTEAGWHQRLRNVFPQARVLEQGQIGMPSSRPEDALTFDYALIHLGQSECISHPAPCSAGTHRHY